MSTYGTAVVIDVRSERDVEVIAAAFRSASAFVDAPNPGGVRVTMYLPAIEQLEQIEHVLSGVGQGRAAVAEDYDEYGALWAVLSASDGVVRTVHRRYILNADPHDPSEVAAALRDLDGTDPRTLDVAGPTAAMTAADVFEVDPEQMIAAESGADTAFERIGVVAGPFPWWPALGLVWPGPAAGQPLGP